MPLRRFIAACALCSGAATAQAPLATGLEFLDDASYRSIPMAAPPLLGTLPPFVDLSADFPAPGNQGSQSSCVGWATAYAFKSFQERRERDWPLDEQSHLFSPAFIYNQVKRSRDCRGGTNFVEALNLLRRDGVATMALFPYEEGRCDSVPTAAVRQAARPFAIADWRRVNVLDEVEVKTQVASGFPVLIGAVVDEGFMRMRGPIVYTARAGAEHGGHAMVLTGYDDDRQAFKLLNSWGTEWGDGGFGWVSYSVFRQMAREGYVAQDIVTSPLPEPAPASPPVPTPNLPAPQPLFAAPSVTLNVPTTTHNVPTASPQGTLPGIRIDVSGAVLNARGKTLQVVAKFSFLNGPPLFANAQEPFFRDIGGLVTTGLPAQLVGSDNESLGPLFLSIPYYALNFQPTNGMSTYNLSLVVMCYLDNNVAAQSPPIPFVLQW